MLKNVPTAAAAAAAAAAVRTELNGQNDYRAENFK